VSRREDFDNSLWSDPEFLALSPEARMTYIWTWTNPRCGMAGIYKTAPVQAAMETGLSEDAVRAALTELGEAQFAFYEGNVLWVRSRVKHLRQKTTQIARAIRNDLAKISDDHPLKAQFMATYRSHSWLKDYIGSEGQVTLTRPISESPPGDGHVTVLGTGTGKGTGGKGWGAGKGNRTPEIPPSDAAVAGVHARLERDAELTQQFPDVPLAFVNNAARRLAARGEAATYEAIRAELEDAGEAA
jgi:hypothetical protein